MLPEPLILCHRSESIDVDSGILSDHLESGTPLLGYWWFQGISKELTRSAMLGFKDLLTLSQ